MKTSKAGELPIAIAVDDDALNRLISIFRKHSKTTDFSVDLSDGSTLYPETLDEILEIPNTPDRAITQIAIKNHYSEPIRIEVTLRANNLLSAIKFDLKGQDQEVLLVDRDFQEWVVSAKQPYSWLTFVSLSGGILFGVTCLIAVAALFAGLSQNGHPVFSVASIFLGVLLIFLASSAPGWIHKVFPRALFLIGDGIRRDQVLRDRRKFFKISIVAAILIGLATRVIAKFLGL
jgi:hypothetical protein